jgi:hypothetical protein
MCPFKLKKVKHFLKNTWGRSSHRPEVFGWSCATPLYGGTSSRNHLIFSNYKKAYGTRSYEAKTLIIKPETHLWPCDSSSGVEPTSRYPTKQESSISNYITKPKAEAESNPVIPTLNKRNKPRADTSASVGSCTAVQSRGRGVDITEGSCTETKYIGRGLQTATNLVCGKEE